MAGWWEWNYLWMELFVVVGLGSKCGKDSTARDSSIILVALLFFFKHLEIPNNGSTREWELECLVKRRELPEPLVSLDKCEWLWSSDEAHDVLALLSIISQCSQWSPYPAWAQSTVNHLELFQRTPTVSVQYDQFMVIDLLHRINLNYQRINMDYVMTSISYFTLMMSIKICWTWKPI